VLDKRPNTTDDGIEDLLQLRMARQEILSRDDAPLVYLLMDESVLHRQAGTAEVMYPQLVHLAVMAARPNVSIQVVPYSTGAHIGLLGAFTIAEAPDMSVTVYLENSADGQTLTREDERVSQVIANFDALRGDALTVAASRDLIVEASEKWKQQV
jgi:hypothetical protein